MADGSFPTLVSKDTAANAVANPIYVVLSDGSAAVGVTGGALDVNVGTVTITASDLDIRALVAGAGSGGDNIGMMANTVKDGTAGTFYYPLVDADGQLQVDVLTAPAIRTITKASDSIQVSKDTSVNSATNPIYVAVTTDVVSATEIHDYDTTVDTGNNDYTVTGTTFLLKSVIFAASGGMKATIQAGPVGTLVTKAVGFIAHQGGTQQLFFDPPIEVPVTSTGTVRVIMTNREGSAQSLYSTIIGNDIP